MIQRQDSIFSIFVAPKNLAEKTSQCMFRDDVNPLNG